MNDQDPWAEARGGAGDLVFWVNAVPRRLRSLGVTGVAPGTLPVWTADVDGHLGCGGTVDAALTLAARAAELAEGKS